MRTDWGNLKLTEELPQRQTKSPLNQPIYRSGLTDEVDHIVATAAVHANMAASSDVAPRLVRREFYFFNLFRVLQATVIVGVMFSPLAIEWVRVLHPTIGRGASVFYLLFSLVVLSVGTRSLNQRAWIDISLVCDIAICALAMFSIQSQFNSLAMLLLVNIGGAALLLPRRMSFFFAALATLAYSRSASPGISSIRTIDRSIEAAICGLTYFSVTSLCIFFGRRMHDRPGTGQPARQRSEQPVEDQRADSSGA